MPYGYQPHYFRTKHNSTQKKFWNTAPQVSTMIHIVSSVAVVVTVKT